MMLITFVCSVMMMAGLFLMLWGGVGFIQDKRFFSSAPKEVQDITPEHVPERFKGQHAVGWIMIVLSFVLFGGAILFGAWDGIKNHFSFWQFFVRFVLMLLGLKAFDIIFFDWVLLCNGSATFALSGESRLRPPVEEIAQAAFTTKKEQSLQWRAAAIDVA